MRAMVRDDDRLQITVSQPSPELGDGEVLLRPRAVLISHADIADLRANVGQRFVPGRAFVGVVENTSADASQFVAGQRVVGAAVTFCGGCDMCIAGLRTHCRERASLATPELPGALCEQFVLPASSLTAAPDSLDNDHAVFAQPVAAALQTARQLTIQGKPYVTVLGDNLLGLVTAQVMARLNASVRLLGANPGVFGLCEKWGVKHRHVDEVGRRADQDIVVCCSDDPAMLTTALRLVRPRGKVALKQSPRNDSAVDLQPLIDNELELIGSSEGSIDHAAAYLARREIDVVSLIGRRMKFDDGEAIFRAAAQPECVSVFVEMS